MIKIRLLKYWKYAVAISLFLLFLSWFNVFESINSLKNMGFSVLILAFLIYSCAQVARATRFYALNNETGYGKNMAVHFIAPILSRVTPGKIGEVGKVLMLKGNKEKLVFAHIIERLMDIVALLLLSVAIFLIYPDIAWIFFIFIILLSIGFVVVWNTDKLFNIAAGLVSKKKLERSWFRKNFSNLSNNNLILALLLSFANWLITAAAFFVIAKAIGINLNFFIFAAIISASIIIGIISGLPGGIGAREISVTLLLVRFGAQNDLASLFAVMFLAFFLISETIFAAFGYVAYKIISPK